MDPNALLAEMLDEARDLLARHDALIQPEEPIAGVDLAQQVLDLHDWLSKGGFVPAAWNVAAANS
jgi:hypothetical protein